MKLIRKLRMILILTVALACFSIGFNKAETLFAADNASQVEVASIDYNALELKLKPNGNSVIYFSTNKSTWNVLEYYVNSEGYACTDISWIAATSNKTLYFKGGSDTRITEVTIPKQNTIKVKFDKVDGMVTISNTEDAEYFQWRKNTDYNWHTVSLEEGSAEYKQFVSSLEQFRVKGAKIVIRTAQTPGTSAQDPGSRPSKEATLSITKRGNAPNVSVNMKTLKLNTTEKMEYSLDGGNTWKNCMKTMTLESLLPNTLYKDGKSAQAGSVLFRKIATAAVPYSKTQTLTIPAQKAAPTTISHYTQDSKYLFLQFSDASTSLIYEYTIVKPGKSFDPVKAVWKAVKKNTPIKLTKTSAPEGSTIYYRYKGITANISKGITPVLPSAYGSFKVTFK